METLADGNDRTDSCRGVFAAVGDGRAHRGRDRFGNLCRHPC